MRHRMSSRGRRIFLCVIATLVCIFVVVMVAFRVIFPQREPIPTTGQYQITSVLHTYIDESRSEPYSTQDDYRQVNVEFWYPEDTEGVFPLVIFSHGALGIRSSNLTLYRELASHGYVVAAVDHPYQAFWSRDAAGKMTYLNFGYLADLQREDAKTDKQQSLEYYQQWMQIRMGDLNLVLDTILDLIANGEGDVYSLIDAEAIGVMGHSLGGAAALGIGRQRGDIQAVIALEAPFLYDIIGVEQDEFVFINQVYPIPVLNIYSDDSWDQLAEWPQYAQNYALLFEEAASVHNVHIRGVGHLALTDLVDSSPFLVRILDRTPTTRASTEILSLINQISLEFFDAYLKNLSEFQGYRLD